MQVTIKSINQRYLLDSDELTTELVIVLPGGTEVVASIDTEQAALIMSGGEIPSESVFSDVEVEPELESDDELVDWLKLSPDMLSAEYKISLMDSGAPNPMPAQELLKQVELIKYALQEQEQEQEELARVQVEPTQSLAQQQAVQFDTTSPQPQVPIARRVQANELGYPMVQQVPQLNSAPAPIENVDEDGVRPL